jgi:hypothetical protein
VQESLSNVPPKMSRVKIGRNLCLRPWPRARLVLRAGSLPTAFPWSSPTVCVVARISYLKGRVSFQPAGQDQPASRSQAGAFRDCTAVWRIEARRSSRAVFFSIASSEHFSHKQLYPLPLLPVCTTRPGKICRCLSLISIFSAADTSLQS